MKNFFMITILSGFILYSCTDDKESGSVIKKDSINGFAQKGPFINGTSITISELNNDLDQTGKSFISQITDNKGGFTANNLVLISPYVNLKADGFYFNEISGEQSAAQITLNALSDISDKSSINVNLLSSLEKPRTEYLIKQGTRFGEAKIQAQAEVLSLFNIQKEGMETSEELDISKEGDDNAILLAVSLILQGYRTEGELTELISNISSDLMEDGVLSTAALGSKLINQALILDTISIRNNLESRYQDLGVEAVIPRFEKYLTNFIEHTSFEITEQPFVYPADGLYGENILDIIKTQYTDTIFSLAADLATGAILKIKITSLTDGIWYYRVMNESETNWNITTFDMDHKSQIFTTIESGRSCDLYMEFFKGDFMIEYFEVGKDVPFRTKTITIVNGSF
jgi:hypothetical protein